MLAEIRGDDGDLRGDRGGHLHDAVQIGVQQVTGRNGEAAEDDGPAEINEMHVGVRNGDAASEELQAGGGDAGKVMHRAVGEDASATECFENVRVNFADEGAEARRVGEVLHNDDARRGEGEEEIGRASCRERVSLVV